MRTLVGQRRAAESPRASESPTNVALRSEPV